MMIKVHYADFFEWFMGFNLELVLTCYLSAPVTVTWLLIN